MNISRRNVPVAHADEAEHRRLLAAALNQILLGRLNNTGTVTLGTGSATTVVDDRKVGESSVVVLMPTTANAAAEAASGNLYVSAVTGAQFTVTHTNSATAGRTFDYVVLG